MARTLRRTLLKSGLPQDWVRKTDKLRRDPERFFFDLFRKRLKTRGQEWILSPEDPRGKATPEGALPRDYITPMHEVYDRLVRGLLERACYLQTMESEHATTRRIAIKYDDYDYVMAAARDVDLGGLELRFTPLGSDKYSLLAVTFTNGVVEYCNPEILLDPWYHSGSLVRSKNPNLFTQVVPDRSLNRTVFTVTPHHLWGSTDEPTSMEAKLGLSRSVLHHVDFECDVVYTWVDGADPMWRLRKEERLRNTRVSHPVNTLDVGASRYTDRGELRYSLRSVASFLPAARRIYIVTDRQVPSWLDVNHPKIRLVDHTEIFPDPAHLPSFNSHAIESNLHRIPGLAEHFVYLNDDVLLMNPCSVLDFFHSNGLSKAFFEPHSNLYGEVDDEYEAYRNAALNGSRLLRERFGRSAHTYHEHVAHAVRKSVMAALWETFPQELARTSGSPFRGPSDISTISFLYHYVAHLQGAAVPAEIDFAYLNLGNKQDLGRLAGLVNDRYVKVLCLNDVPGDEVAKERALQHFFGTKFPVAAPWEMDR